MKLHIAMLLLSIPWAACADRSPPAPSPAAMTPNSGPSSQRTSVRILGEGFVAQVHASYDDKDLSKISTDFSAMLGGHALEAVAYLGTTELSAVVPAGLPSGSHTLVLVDPRGVEGTLMNAYTVVGPQPPDGGTDGGSPPDGSSGTDASSEAGVSDGALQDGSACPPSCTNGCAGGVCEVDCQTGCTCPAGVRCEVTCGQDQCTGIVDCGTASACTVRCEGDSSCGNEIRCPPGGDCAVSCQGSNSCGASINCGASNACTVECLGQGACVDAIVCGLGMCQVDCSGTSACSDGVDCSRSCGCSVSGSGVSLTCPAGCSQCRSTDNCDNCS